MLHLNEELKALEGLGNIIDSAISKLEAEISNNNTPEGLIIKSHTKELREALITGEGLDELTDRLRKEAEEVSRKKD